MQWPDDQDGQESNLFIDYIGSKYYTIINTHTRLYRISSNFVYLSYVIIVGLLGSLLDSLPFLLVIMLDVVDALLEQDSHIVTLLFILVG